MVVCRIGSDRHHVMSQHATPVGRNQRENNGEGERERRRRGYRSKELYFKTIAITAKPGWINPRTEHRREVLRRKIEPGGGLSRQFSRCGIDPVMGDEYE